MMQPKEIKLTRKQEAIASDDKKFLVPTFVTTDYDKFMLIESNRLIKPGKSSKLKEEIERKDLTSENEIKVAISESGDKLIISDGQHRFVTCKELL